MEERKKELFRFLNLVYNYIPYFNSHFFNKNFMIFPTKYKNESFPLVVLEAFMYGIPVFSYDTGAISEIISEKYLGYVSKEKNPKDLAEKLGKMINKNPDQKKIREYFKKRYSFVIAEKNLKKIFDKELK